MTHVTFAPILLAKAYHMATLILTGGGDLLGKEPEYLNRSSDHPKWLCFLPLKEKKRSTFLSSIYDAECVSSSIFLSVAEQSVMCMYHISFIIPLELDHCCFHPPDASNSVAVTILVHSSFGPLWELPVEWIPEMGLLGLRVPCLSFQDEAHA